MDSKLNSNPFLNRILAEDDGEWLEKKIRVQLPSGEIQEISNEEMVNVWDLASEMPNSEELLPTPTETKPKKKSKKFWEL